MHHFQRFISLALASSVVVAACATNPAGNPNQAPVPVKTLTLVPTTISGTVAYSGNVEPLASVTILPKIAGQITVLNVDVGSVVKKGEVIAELDHAALDAQVAQARAAVAVAASKLASLEAGSRPETIAEARANLQAAQATLAVMEQGGRPENVAAAQGNLTAALARLRSLQQGRAQMVAQARANLAAAQARLQALKAGPTPAQLAVAQQAVEAAKDAAYAANVTKDGACNPRNPAYLCQAAQAQADAAATAVNQARAQLAVLTSPPTPQQLAQAQAAVDAAQAQLALAARPGSATDLAAAQGAVQAAQAQLALAKAPYTAADLAKAQAAVAVAQQQLRLAEHPTTPEDLAAAQAALQQAQAGLTAATVARSEATITAPINGVVATRQLAVGSLAAPGTPIVTVIDPRVEVVVNVDASSAELIKTGQPATITTEALPGTAIPGTVTTVAPALDPRTRTLMVKITPRAPATGLKAGMLVTVTLVTVTHRGVLAVPSAAIVQRNGQPTVYVVVNGRAEPRVVQTGLSDGQRTEITSGLRPGEIIVVSGQDRLTTPQPVTVQTS